MPAPRLISLTDVKLRTFIRPGQQLELAAELRDALDGSTEFALVASSNGKRIAMAGLCFQWH